jgi:large subunit ribosomal protein L25
MAERATIQAAPRTVLGKQVAQLRRKGILPANVYGKGLPSLAIQIDAREFVRNIKGSGLRSMFELAVSGEPASRHVVLRGITRAGGTGDPIHVDFFQVDPNRPIHANVPVRVVGESPAVRDLAGTLVQSVEHVGVKCLPLAIPESLEADAGLLKSFDVSLTVGDLKVPAGVEVLADPGIVVASVTPPRIRLELGAEEEAAESAPAE